MLSLCIEGTHSFALIRQSRYYYAPFTDIEGKLRNILKSAQLVS